MVQRKSDCVVLPMKRVMIGEGSAQQKGAVQVKTTEPHTAVGNWVKHSDNAGNNDPVSRRARIAAKARSDSSFQFTNLMHHLDRDLVEECLARIPKNSAPGKNQNQLLYKTFLIQKETGQVYGSDIQQCGKILKLIWRSD